MIIDDNLCEGLEITHSELNHLEVALEQYIEELKKDFSVSEGDKTLYKEIGRGIWPGAGPLIKEDISDEELEFRIQTDRLDYIDELEKLQNKLGDYVNSVEN